MKLGSYTNMQVCVCKKGWSLKELNPVAWKQNLIDKNTSTLFDYIPVRLYIFEVSYMHDCVTFKLN